jgi:hypothetical protein
VARFFDAELRILVQEFKDLALAKTAFHEGDKKIIVANPAKSIKS